MQFCVVLFSADKYNNNEFDCSRDDLSGKKNMRRTHEVYEMRFITVVVSR